MHVTGHSLGAGTAALFTVYWHALQRAAAGGASAVDAAFGDVLRVAAAATATTSTAIPSTASAAREQIAMGLQLARALKLQKLPVAACTACTLVAP